MGKPQLIAIASAVALFLALYVGCEVKSREQKTAEHSRKVTGASVSVETLLQNALSKLSAAQRNTLTQLQTAAQSAQPTTKAETLKQLSRFWHDAQDDAIAADYARQIAEIEKTDAAWEIAGANFFLALQQNQEKDVRDFCFKGATDAFQNAVSLNPQRIEHKVNLALCYAENPPPDNPMKSAMMLLELDKANPQNSVVNFQLARLAVKTGQFEKAIKRLETVVLKNDPNNRRAQCLAAEAYAGVGDAQKATEFGKKCKQ